MTAEQYAEREELIAERVAFRWRGEERTFYLTRNRVCGRLAAKVDAWWVHPTRRRFDDGDVWWFSGPDDGEGENPHCGRWNIATARSRVGNGVPETDLECLVVGREGA